MENGMNTTIFPHIDGQAGDYVLAHIVDNRKM
jgi:hypothetical protein